jgi:hypothetical protein
MNHPFGSSLVHGLVKAVALYALIAPDGAVEVVSLLIDR